MRRKWCKYVLSSAMAFCGIYANGMLHSAFAQQAEQHSAASRSEMEDLKWQLKQMEESVLRQQEQMESLHKKQQEEVQALKNRIEAITSGTMPTAYEEKKREIPREEVKNLQWQSEQMKEAVSRQQEQIQAINNRLNATNASVEDVKKIGSTAQEPNDFRVYWKEGLNFDSINKNFKLKIGGRIHQDWGWFTEDKEIRDTIGDQVDGAEFRRSRIYLSGTIYKNIDFKMEYDFAGGGRPSFTDVFVELKEIPVAGNFKVGHFKEPFSLEELTSSNYITFMERSLPNVFAPARNTGMMLHNTLADKRMTWAAGVFRNANDFGDSEGNESTEGGYSFSGRLTGLPWYEEEGRKLLHTGIGYSYQNAFQNEIRYRQTPEMHMADIFVDTGAIEAEAAHLFGPELSLVYGPFSLQTEYIFANVDLEDGGGSDPDFSGFYVYGSYFLTGENRRYETKSGTFDKVKPKKNFKWGESLGAIELAARYSALDLADEGISGGRLQDTTVGVNWYLNPNMRIMLNYVHSEADVSGEDGSADLVGMRFNIFF